MRERSFQESLPPLPERTKPTQLSPEEIEALPDLTDEAVELHEVMEAFEDAGLPLNEQLQEMLGEHKNQQGNRKGSGFTQASRHLADYIRRPRSARDMQIFDASVTDRIRQEYEQQHPESHEDLRDTRPYINKEKLRAVLSTLRNEESLLIAKMIVDLIDTERSREIVTHDVINLPAAREKIEIGTCTTAELYFLEFLHDKGAVEYRRGHMNVITDTKGIPIMLEKIGLGEDHSCLTLQETVLNGVQIPPGSLLAVKRRELPTHIFRLDECEGFEFLRLTTLAVSPENRKRAFTAHHAFQEQNRMPGFDTTTIDAFRTEAELMVRAYSPKKSW